MTLKIKACVRMNKLNQLELFFYDEHKTLNCFAFEESHNEASYKYMISCKLVSEDVAKGFIKGYNDFYSCVSANYDLVYSKKLSTKNWSKQCS